MGYVSKKINSFLEQGSEIRKMFEEGAILKQKYGAENVFDLSLGNPIMVIKENDKSRILWKNLITNQEIILDQMKSGTSHGG